MLLRAAAALLAWPLSAVALEEAVGQALYADDTCAPGGGGSCGTELLQRRGVQVHRHQVPTADWQPLGGGNEVADAEGEELFQAAGDVEKCGQICSIFPGCKSFAYCGNQACYMRTADVAASSGHHYNQFCSTYFNNSKGAGGGNGPGHGSGEGNTTAAPGSGHGSGDASTTPEPPKPTPPADTTSTHLAETTSTLPAATEKTTTASPSETTTVPAPEDTTTTLPAAVTTTEPPAETTTTSAAPAETTTTIAAPTETTTTASPGPAAKCYKFRSKLVMNEKQKFAGNPDADVSGEVELTLCTDGNLTGSMKLSGGVSQVIATHLDRCVGGDTPQTQTSVLCDGPPLVNFCGDNSPGLIDDGTDYTGLCADYNGQGEADTANMTGVVVAKTNGPMTVAERVEDIYAHPDLYYFNVHTMASYNHWYPKAEGMARGPLISADQAPTTTAIPLPPASAPPSGEEDTCFNMFSQMTLNELQVYADNPDAGASGYTNMLLCTNGTLKATMLVFSGKSQIIATNVHLCHGGDSPQTRTGDLCQGPPVMNFCGENSPGMLEDGTAYPDKCAAYNQIGASRTKDMQGLLVASANRDTSVAQRVRHIAEHPELYYFNVHTMASWNHWYPEQRGACRGPVEISHR